MNLFKPKRMTIHSTWYKDVYCLRLSQGTSILRDGKAAHLSLYGNKKTISKAFHKVLKDLDMPNDRINWKQVDMGRMA